MLEKEDGWQEELVLFGIYDIYLSMVLCLKLWDLAYKMGAFLCLFFWLYYAIRHFSLT